MFPLEEKKKYWNFFEKFVLFFKFSHKFLKKFSNWLKIFVADLFREIGMEGGLEDRLFAKHPTQTDRWKRQGAFCSKRTRKRIEETFTPIPLYSTIPLPFFSFPLPPLFFPLLFLPYFPSLLFPNSPTLPLFLPPAFEKSWLCRWSKLSLIPAFSAFISFCTTLFDNFPITHF